MVASTAVVRVIAAVGLVLGLSTCGVHDPAPEAPSSEASRPPLAQPDIESHARRSLLRIPLYFIENRGQVDGRVAYYVQGHDKTLYFTPEGITFALVAPREPAEREHDLTGTQDPRRRAALEAEAPRERWTVKLDFVGTPPATPTWPETPTPPKPPSR